MWGRRMWVSVDMSRWIDPGCTLDELCTKSLAYAEINVWLFASKTRLLSNLFRFARGDQFESVQIDLYIPHIVHIFSLAPLFLRGAFADEYDGEYDFRAID